MTEIEQFDTVSAVFKPRRTDDLTDAGKALVGQRITCTADYRVDEGYPYAGEWHMTLIEEDWERTKVFWVPSGDLAEVVMQ